MAKLITNWKELNACAEMPNTHYLKIDEDGENGYICTKDNTDTRTDTRKYYLSTHTFYERNHKFSTELLKECGFDIELQSWG